MANTGSPCALHVHSKHEKPALPAEESCLENCFAQHMHSHAKTLKTSSEILAGSGTWKCQLAAKGRSACCRRSVSMEKPLLQAALEKHINVRDT